MEHFKNATRKLYAKRPLFFNIGLVIAISLCFIAFEFKVFINEEERVELPEDEIIFLSDDIIPTSQPPKPQPEKLPEPKGDVNIVEVKELPKMEEKTKNIDIEKVLESLSNDFAVSDEKVEDNSIHDAIALEVNPQFSGGIEAFYKYVSNAIEYPTFEQRQNIEGRVVLSFVIEKDGSLSKVKILKGVSDGIDKEAIRVIENAPKWEAGRQRGQAVRVRMNIPIYFKLR